MKKIRRWKLVVLVTAGSILLIAGVGYFVLVYKFKEILRAVVKKESHGLYAFNASKVRLSVWSARITLNNVSVTALDTANVSAHYSLTAKKVYLSVLSLKDLMFNDKLLVNDIIINEPSFHAHVHTEKPHQGERFHGSGVTDVVSRLAQRLQVRSFELTKASFHYSSLKNKQPFVVDNINLKISNFKKKDAVTNDLLYTDDIDLTITDQSWTFPGAKQNLKFARLHYSAKDQFIQLDTCTITVKEKIGADTISLYADQFRFAPRQLQEHLSKDELVIDSLICTRPILILHKGEQPQLQRASTGSISSAFNQVFNRVNLRYIDIEKGSFAIYEKNRSSSSYATERVDVQVYNLQALAGASNGLSVDSIKFKLNNLSFVTRDSLYQLTVGEFRLRNNDLTFLNATFGNAPGNPRPANMSFTTPELRFRNIDLEELMKKKLKAPAITIYRPDIVLFAVEKKQRETDSLDQFSTEDFYKVLHGVDELINVDSFRIVEGKMRFRSSKNNLKADLTSVSGVVLINKFLKSDSLVDIKRALPQMNIGLISMTGPAFDLHADNFHFKGAYRETDIDAFTISLKNGTIVSGKKLSSELLDWDIFQQKKIIDIKRLVIRELNTNIASTTAGNKAGKLPKLRVGELEVDRMNLQMKKAGQVVTMYADDLAMTNLSSLTEHLTWNDLSADINNFRMQKGGLQASFNSLQLTNTGINEIRDVNIEAVEPGSKIAFHSPVMNMESNLQSSDFSNLLITSLRSDSATFDIITNNSGEDAKVSVIDSNQVIVPGAVRSTGKYSPVVRVLQTIALNDLELRNNTFRFSNERDSIKAQAKFDIDGNTIEFLSKGPTPVSFKSLELVVRDLVFDENQIKASIPSLGVKLANGGLTVNSEKRYLLNTDLSVDWDSLRLRIAMDDSVNLVVTNLSGSYAVQQFNLLQGSKINWLQQAKYAKARHGDITYSAPGISASVEDLTWNGPAASMETGSFAIIPATRRAGVSPGWQKDDVSVSGEKINIAGISYDPGSGDSMLAINKMIVEKIILLTTRDKRQPFRHGTIKLMPTTLIRSIPLPMLVDSLLIRDGNVTVREVSAQTKKMGTIPLEQLQATITNITNRTGPDEVLQVSASAVLLGNRIDHLKYEELYGDSMSPFIMKFYASPMKLTRFTKATQPLASVGVVDGRSDTLYAHWVGNKYAAIGRMNFHYKGLKIALLNKDNPEKKPFKLRIINFLANGILRNKNKKEAMVFYERDQEKFVFNYWVKTTFSGLMTSVGVKRNRKYFNQYNKVKEMYYLPDLPPKGSSAPARPKALSAITD